MLPEGTKTVKNVGRGKANVDPLFTCQSMFVGGEADIDNCEGGLMVGEGCGGCWRVQGEDSVFR